MKSRVSYLISNGLIIFCFLFMSTLCYADTITNETEGTSVVPVSGKIGKQKKDNDHSQPTSKQTLVIDRSSLEDKQLPQLGDSKNRIVWYGYLFLIIFLYLLRIRKQKTKYM
jgi:hypothetical protein